jgi:hypothetical protein
MPSLAFGLGAYSRGNGRLPRVRLINLFAEEAPTAQAGVALIQRPGLERLYTVSGAPRGFYKQDGVLFGSLISVHGATIYTDGTVSGAVTGSDQVEWAYTTDGMFLLADGVIQTSTDGLAWSPDATFPDSAAVASIASINNILVAVRSDNGRVYYRFAGEGAWDGLNFFSAEREEDPAIAVKKVGDELWVFGTTSIEPYYPTGETEVPFERLDGRAIQRGVKDRDSIALLDNTVFWVGEDNKAYRGGGTPQRISDHGIEEQIEASSTVKAWTYETAGHAMYVVTLDTETLCYDVATQQWHELTYDGGRFAPVGLYAGNQTYVGLTDRVFVMADRSNDDGAEIERLFTSVAPAKGPVSCDCIEVVLSSGTSVLGSPATLQLRWSDDQGRTWSTWESDTIGDEGAYRKRVRYRRLGMIDAPGRLFEHRITDNAPIRFSGVDLNPPLGGRGR